MSSFSLSYGPYQLFTICPHRILDQSSRKIRSHAKADIVVLSLMTGYRLLPCVDPRLSPVSLRIPLLSPLYFVRSRYINVLNSSKMSREQSANLVKHDEQPNVSTYTTAKR